jgi:hypothetical protein
MGRRPIADNVTAAAVRVRQTKKMRELMRGNDLDVRLSRMNYFREYVRVRQFSLVSSHERAKYLPRGQVRSMNLHREVGVVGRGH